MKERTRTILETAVRDFIRDGRPLTSDYLYERYDFGIKPAMIRWELQALADEGYFYQLRPSGGRFPTRKAYAAYVESIEKDEKREKPLRKVRATSPLRQMAELPQEIADALNVMGAGYDPRRRVFRECGLTNLIEELETEAREELLSVVRDVERLEERLVSHLGAWEDDEGPWPKIFVGETPLTKTKLLSVLVGRAGSARDPFFVLAVGPLRMDYEKSLALFRTFDEM
jgi:transcriptional regulator of heat shock response